MGHTLAEMSFQSEPANSPDAAVDAANRQGPASQTAETEKLPPISPDFVEEALGENLDDAVPTRGYRLTPIVGLGGSAGGIQALSEFFQAMPADSGLVFVVVLHLPPERESSLAELLQRVTPMPVVPAEDGVKVEANHVYVIPPGKHLVSTDGHLRLTPLQPARARGVAVDIFFRTLADTHGPHAVAIVLSGADGDGAVGLKRIKERGGLTIAQHPDEAEHDSMPRTAIETGMVDWMLTVGEMPARLLEYTQREGRLKLPPEDGPQPAEPIPQSRDDGEAELREVLVYLRTRTGHDFTYYKRATILRRISRRMLVNGMEDMPAYLEFLRTHVDEEGALLQDLLISVTNFFRDREAFAALEAQIPGLFHGKGASDTVRVWCAACATGEEAYSIAMLLCEHAAQLAAPPTLHVFATDLDEAVIKRAREGSYPPSIVADVSEERTQRFFTKEDRGYQVRRELREVVLFAVHDLLKDSPFSKLDLVTCRNLFIYLNPDAQKRALDIFHFALRSEGRLFLGTSETVDGAGELFETLDKKHRLYKRRPAVRIGLPVPSGPGTISRSLHERESAASRSAASTTSTPVAPLSPQPDTSAGRAASAGELHWRLFEQCGPDSMLIDGQQDIVHLSAAASRYLQFDPGELTKNLLRAVHPMLRIELRTALYRAAQTHQPTEALDVPIDLDGQRQAVDIRVSCAPEISPDHFLIVFLRRAASPAANPSPSEDDTSSQQLERELTGLKAHLRDVVEQYEATTEEHKAGNEELQATNEELRSASEELETSREELQSINEELTTVNQELKGKVDELGQANGDLRNLINATAIATIFLDRELRINRYTPTATALFNLIPSDVGRHLSDLRHRLEYPELERDAERVLAQLVPIEREVGKVGDGWFLARLLPYRTVDDRIAGIVLTFVDVTERRKIQQALQESEERLQLVMDSASDFAIFTMDDEGIIMSWNHGAEVLFGYSAAEIIGLSGMMLCAPEDRDWGRLRLETATAYREGRAVDERWHCRKDGSLFWGSGSLVPLRPKVVPGDAVLAGVLMILSDRTVVREGAQELEAQRQQLLEALQANVRAREEIETASNAKDHFLAVLSHELRTPLTPIIMALGMLEGRADLPVAVTRALEMIGRNVKLEAHFIDDLLDMTRITHGKMEIAREPMDLHEAALRAVEVTQPDLDAKGQRLELGLYATEHRVSGDFARLQQALWNLLKNASKFTSQGGVITLRSRHEPPDRVAIEVTDTGIGMEAEVLARIFHPFEQADPGITRQFGGLGLGLAIAKAAVDAHEGELSASSPGSGQGSTFTAILPLAAHNEQSAEPAK